MKSTLTLSLDTEIILKLKQENNYSDVVNEQMKAFYNADSIEKIPILKQNLAEIKQILKKNRIRQRDINKKIKQIAEKERLHIIEMKKNFKFSEASVEEQRAFVRNVLKGGK